MFPLVGLHLPKGQCHMMGFAAVTTGALWLKKDESPMYEYK